MDNKEELEKLNLLGVSSLRERDFLKAGEYFQKAIKLYPLLPELHYNLGLALQKQGKFSPAKKSFLKALSLRGNYAEAYNNLGIISLRQGILPKARGYFRQAIKNRPNFSDAYNNLGFVLKKEKKLIEAEKCFKQTLLLDPNYTEANFNLGLIYKKKGAFDTAEKYFHQTLRLNPNHAGAYYNLGVLQLIKYEKERGKTRLQEAENFFALTLKLRPDDYKAYNELGYTLIEQGKLLQAEECLRKALELRPNYGPAYNNLGLVYLRKSKFDKAEKFFRRARKLSPKEPALYCNLGIISMEKNHWKKAEVLFRQGIKIGSDSSNLHLNFSRMLFLNGNFQKGWREYEFRLRDESYCLPPTLFHSFLKWNGSKAKDKSILVVGEQGIGDAIQFIRYFPMVRDRVGHLIFACQHKTLIPLIKNCKGIDELIEMKKPEDILSKSNLFDLYIPLLSLPNIFHTTINKIPANIPYIQVNPVLKEKWNNTLRDDRNFKVGIIWAGNPKHPNDYNRSCLLSDFHPLAKLNSLSWFSLQKGPSAAQLSTPPEGMKIIDLGKDLNDFADTAAVIANLDLVITVDTAVAHLAGALGKPVWMLLSFLPDGRWLLERKDSPWYPTMRLFRQTKTHHWAEVFLKVRKELLKLVKNKEENGSASQT